MTDCFRCGKSINSSDLLECVHQYGIVYVCKDCYPKFRSPIIEKKNVNWDEVDTRSSVRQKLTNLSGVNMREKKGEIFKKKNPEDMTLRDIVEKNFDQNKLVAREVPNDLVDNFHWAIMRRRRAMKVTILELSEKISEPEAILISLEKGILPRDYAGLIRKVESFLGISLYKQNKKIIQTEDILAESKIPTGILISDIKEKSKGFMNWFKKKSNELPEEKFGEELIDAKELSLEKIEEVFGKPFGDDIQVKSEKNPGPLNEENEDFSENKEKIEDEDLTQEEIDKLIWRS